MALSTTTLKSFGTCTVHEHVLFIFDKMTQPMYMHERQAERSTNQSVHDAELWTVIFRVFRVHIAAACRADRPHSVRRAQRNPPPTNRYCPQRNTTTITVKSSSTQEEGKLRGRTRGGRDRKEGWNVASSNLEKGCVFGGETGRVRRKRIYGIGRGGVVGGKAAAIRELSVSVC